jgi:hypothetical protein
MTVRLKREDSFLQNGVIDSTGVLELVGYLEQSYKIEVSDHELVAAESRFHSECGGVRQPEARQLTWMTQVAGSR